MARVKEQLTKYRSKRDFRKTGEPSGAATKRRARRAKGLEFVVQKHAASQLHFDLRLELDGVMKSWAVPKGPSLDPGNKRLAMQVEDHPMDYNTFEGTIPEGQYGGGTVMIWDRGTYTAEKAAAFDGSDEEAVRDGLDRGDLKIRFHGERLTGSFVLVRTRTERGKAQWLLIKHRDESAEPGSDVVAEYDTSIVSGKTMDQIGDGDSAVWQSDRKGTTRKRTAAVKKVVGAAPKLDISKAITPMLATLAKDLPKDGRWTYEPKYDGIRVLAFITPSDVRLITRNAKDKTKQFPEIVGDLKKLPGKTGRNLVLDGEIVVLTDGEPARFQELQSRMHVENALSIKRLSQDLPAALIGFDLLVDGDDILVNEAWSDRRTRLQKRLGRKRLPALRLGETSEDPEAMLRAAQEHGWEGIMAKRMESLYRPGIRSRDWLKLKLERRQEFVVGGYTEPRNSRQHIGALLLGYYSDDGDFIYAGHTGGGFTRQSLREMYERLHALERKTSPFTTTPKTNEKPHWVKPEIVVEVRFNEWTNEGKLRQPVFLGVREDKEAAEVRREG